ncbi:MAG: hypothetical protein LQ346_002094 [Caloplaca aetnensis]|nr:MAG: hypothetical protein LQ346_002094 [Caloplaca aetnensis]
MATSVLPPPGMDITADEGGRIVATMAALIVIPTITVIARLLSRRLAHAGFWFLSYGPIICVLISHATNGFGRHIWALQDGEEKTIEFMRILYVYGVFYYASVSAIKIAMIQQASAKLSVSVCVISIIRLVVLARLNHADLTWNYVNSAIWTAAEPCMGVVSACLPSLRPLVTLRLKGTAPGIQNRSTTDRSGSYGSSKTVWRNSTKTLWRNSTKSRENSEGGGRHFQRLDDPLTKHSRWHRDVTVRGGKDIERGSSGEDISLRDMDVPSGQIRVKEEVVITSTDWLDYQDRVY